MEMTLNADFLAIESDELELINGDDSVDWLGIVLSILGLEIGAVGFLLHIPFAGTIGAMVTIVSLLIAAI